MPTTLTNGIQLPDKGSVDWYNSMQSNYNLIDTHLGNTDTHVTAEDKANWNSKQGSLSQAQLDAIAQVATNTSDIATLQSGKADASHTHSSSDITDIGDYATKQYVDTSISGLVDNAPAALDTLNELSAALNDDANFASTVTNALSAKANSADLATVATSGSYNDLSNKPTINDSTITIQKNGSTVDTFTTNGSAKTINIPVPTKTSDLTNDSNFVVSSSLATVATSGFYNDLDNKPYIPDKISDLIDDSNFVDTSNPAVSSGITSAKVTDYDTHIADTDIHVTTADKNKWNNQTYVFRYSSTALVASSTNSNALLDNTDNLKVGDKVIDSDGVLFSITAIDTQNSTFTIGTALVDLAQDSDVVHKSGNETVGGQKTFSSDITLQGTTTPVIKTISNIIQDSTGGNESISWVIRDRTDSNTVFAQSVNKFSGQSVDFRLDVTSILNGTSSTRGINLVVDPVNESYRFTSRGNNTLDLGTSTNRWKSVYAMNYYYGSNNVEFSTKFVTTDTAQTITGAKTFSSNTKIYNSDSTADTPNLILQSSKILVGDRTSSDTQSLIFNGGPSWISRVDSYKDDGGTQNLQLKIRTKDNDNNLISSMCRLRIFTDNTQFFEPEATNVISLGRSGYKWKDVQTNLVNGVEPSSLSLPSGNASDVIDISSYITDLSGAVNLYTVPANGYVTFTFSNGARVQIYPISGGGVSSSWVSGGSAGIIRGFMPVLKNSVLRIVINATTMDSFYFIPCQGNV